MFFYDDKKFDILYKNMFTRNYTREEFSDLKKNFILNNTTLDFKDIEEEHIDDLFDFVFEATNFNSKETFTKTVNETIELFNNKLFKFITGVLLGIDYKISDIVKLNKKELIQTFVAEITYNKEKINKDIFVEQMTDIFDKEYAEELCNAFGITESQKAKELEEQKNLIEQLQNL
ncbi:hypothetical protein [Cetobacterium sp.]|uniref:hypothetical protein n=1 Tax=Cetobacterium sp. TaxID=2071632 RepID=UPI003F2F436F